MFTEDLTVFFQAADFADAATYNGATAVNVIFDRAFLDQFGIVGGARTVAAGKADDFADPVGKTLNLRGTTYTIRSRELVEDGETVIMRLEV